MKFRAEFRICFISRMSSVLLAVEVFGMKAATQELLIKEIIVAYWEKYGSLPNAGEMAKRIRAEERRLDVAR